LNVIVFGRDESVNQALATFSERTIISIPKFLARVNLIFDLG
jgi:hypothetical protein